MNLKFLLLNNISLKQTIFKNSLWLMVAEVVSKAPTFFLNILIIRYLGTQDYGKFAFAFAFASMFAAFADFGLSILTVREVAKNKKLVTKYINNFLPLKLLLALATLFAIFTTIQFLGKSPEIKILVYLVAAFTIITSFISFFQAIFQAFEKMEYLAISKIAYSFSFCSIILFIIWQKMGLKILVGGYIGAGLITLVVTIILVRKRFAKFRFKVDYNFLKKTLSQVWPFGLIALLGSLRVQINTIQIGIISTNTQVGLYGAASQFILILAVVAGFFFTPLFPALAKEYGRSKKGFYDLIGFFEKKIIAFSFAACLFLFLASKKLISLLYGASYSGSADILRLLLISIFILLIGAIYSGALRVANRQKQYLGCLLSGVLLNFLLNFPLISFWGGVGASLSAIFSSSLITISTVVLYKRLKRADLPRQ